MYNNIMTEVSMIYVN